VTLGYRPALDGLRGVAIAAVVLFHAGGLVPAGYLGVDLFFVLSGFLITSILLAEQRSTGAVSLRRFFRRRAARLLPALYCLLAVFAVTAIVLQVSDDRELGRDVFGVIAGIGYIANFAVMGEPGVRAMPAELKHLWSLAAEEQFYLVWPAVLVLALRVRARPAVVLLTIGTVLLTLRGAQLYHDGASFQRLAFGVDTRGTSILVGCLLAFALASRGDRPLRARWIQPVGLSTLAVLLFVDLGRAAFAGPLLLFSICAAFVIAFSLDETSVLNRALAVAQLVFLGRISYSLYLWHVPVFVVLGVHAQTPTAAAVPAVALSLALATASYYLVELPFLHRRGTSSTRPRPQRLVLPSVSFTRTTG
jgi:peptidoglycan/LPS O-acetylase OafA/YrhL